ncbi:MAG TPA: hypothetical protein VM784_11500 [Actinomycetota bacterium]|nr:hypothetical protein [Actinomycetota bacterium]
MTSGPVVLLDGDLLARGRLQEATHAKGLDLRIIGSAAGAGELRNLDPSMVVVDLDNGRERALALVEEARLAGLDAPVIGFFSHVDRALETAAEAAGVRAIRRGRFWAKLPEVLDEG